MSDSESFLGRSDVKAALDDLVAHRFQLTEEGQTDAELSHRGVRDRMAAAGYGPSTKVRAEDVLARLKDKS